MVAGDERRILIARYLAVDDHRRNSFGVAAAQSGIGDERIGGANDQTIHPTRHQILQIGCLLGRRFVRIGDEEFDILILLGLLLDGLSQRRPPRIALRGVAETDEPSPVFKPPRAAAPGRPLLS